jgi:hypothetical protein
MTPRTPHPAAGAALINTTSCPSIEERMNSIDEELIEAVREDNLPEIRRLLSVGADMNYKDEVGEMPLN